MATITIKAHCDKYQPRIDGTAHLYLRITINRKSRLIPLHKYINPAHFDFTTKRVKALKEEPNAKKLNRFLNEQETKIEDIILDLQAKGKPVTFEVIKSLYEGKQDNDFISYCRQELNNEKPVLGERTYKEYCYRLNKLETYKPHITIHEIDRNFLEKYRNYLSEKLGNRQNTYEKDFALIRKFIKKAFEADIIKSNPFTTFKVDKEEVDKAHLTIEELECLMELYTSKQLLQIKTQDSRGKTYIIGKKYQETLQHFLIACFSGLRLSDIKKLRKQHIQDGFIVIKMTKGRKGKKKTVRIPLTHMLLSVLDLTRPDDKVYEGFVRNANDINPWLRFIIESAGINKYLTFHCSRHTFAVNALVLGMSLETVSDLLGHADYRTTQIYAKIVDAKRSEEMSKWNKLFKRNDIATNIEVYCPACHYLTLQVPKGLLNLEHLQLNCPSCQYSFKVLSS